MNQSLATKAEAGAKDENIHPDRGMSKITQEKGS